MKIYGINVDTDKPAAITLLVTKGEEFPSGTPAEGAMFYKTTKTMSGVEGLYIRSNNVWKASTSVFPINVNFTNLTTGQYLTYDGTNWINSSLNLFNPTFSSPIAGQVLTYDGTKWINSALPSSTFLPNVSSPTVGQFMVYDGVHWVNKTINYSFSPTITSPTTGQVITYNGTKWVNSLLSLFTPVLTNPISGQVLSYNGTNWINSSLNFFSPVLTTPTTGQVLTYDGAHWVNTTLTTSFAPTISNVQIGQILCYNGSAWVNVYSEVTPKVITSNTALLSTDTLILVQQTAAIQITLPQTSSNKRYIIKDSKGKASVYSITLKPTGTDTIDYKTTRVITTNYQADTLIYDSINKNWIVI